MDFLLNSVLARLDTVDSSVQFRDWVRSDLRQVLPHASFLATIGRLYGMGSVPTHRLEVDYPLNMVEDLKNSAGALDDPLMHGWFRTERLRYVDINPLSKRDSSRNWRNVLSGFGFRGMMIHGVMDHKARRFVAFQIGNPFGGGSLDTARLMTVLTPSMARAVWLAIDQRSVGCSRELVGHPTLSLTPTELQIVELLAQGLSNKEIARRRGVSDSTVKTQVQRTGAKLGATRRAEIVAIALPMLSPLPAQTLIDYDDSSFE